MLGKLEYLFSHHAILSQEVMWGTFGVVVLLLLFFDLFIFNRKNEEPNFMHTLILCVLYIVAACLFGLFVIYERGVETGMDYFTGFLVEKSLSLDNIFIMSLVFSSIGVPRQYQHRVLFWGILGAIVMRALLIYVGETLISNFHWVLYVFSAVLVYTGIKMLVVKNENEEKFENTKVFKLVSKIFNVTGKLHGEHFFARENNKLCITPLFFALIVIEVMDVIFALDSIPAIFLITQDVFVVYTSNIFAILGLRALYFLLEAVVHKFKYLKPALAIILIFIGLKIFVPKLVGFELEAGHSLAVTFGLLFGGIGISVYKTEKE